MNQENGMVDLAWRVPYADCQLEEQVIDSDLLVSASLISWSCG